MDMKHTNHGKAIKQNRFHMSLLDGNICGVGRSRDGERVREMMFKDLEHV